MSLYLSYSIPAGIGLISGFALAYMYTRYSALYRAISTVEAFRRATSNKKWYSSFFSKYGISQIEFGCGKIYTAEELKSNGFIANIDLIKNQDEAVIAKTIAGLSHKKINSITFATGNKITIPQPIQVSQENNYK